MLAVLAKWADNNRFFAGTSIPSRLIDQVRFVHENLPSQLLGIVDISMTGTGRTFLAFIPEGLIFKTFGLSRSAELLGYNEFLKQAVSLDKGLYIEPDFFDRLAYDLGIDRRSRESPLSVRVGGVTVSDGLDHRGASRLFNLLSDLKGNLRKLY